MTKPKEPKPKQKSKPTTKCDIFNPSTNIFFSLPRNSRVTLDIYNIKGELIQRLINNKSYPLGHHSIKFDGKQLSSGVYFYKLKSGKFEQTHKMMLVK